MNSSESVMKESLSSSASMVHVLISLQQNASMNMNMSLFTGFQTGIDQLASLFLFFLVTVTLFSTVKVPFHILSNK